MGRTFGLIMKMIEEKGVLHATLLDPDLMEYTPAQLASMARIAVSAGSDLVFLGGSTITDSTAVERVTKAIKETVDVPVILFPGNMSGIAPSADAILFMSLLNSANPYYITGVQALAAPLIKKIGLEAIPMAYIVVEPGAAAGYIGWARPLPRNKPALVAAYVAAAELMGFRFAYLEAGSGAGSSVPPEAIAASRKISQLPIIVGGGLTSPNEVGAVVKAGASIVVQGTFVERTVPRDGGRMLKKIIKAMQEAVRR